MFCGCISENLYPTAKDIVYISIVRSSLWESNIEPLFKEYDIQITWYAVHLFKSPQCLVVGLKCCSRLLKYIQRNAYIYSRIVSFKTINQFNLVDAAAY